MEWRARLSAVHAMREGQLCKGCKARNVPFSIFAKFLNQATGLLEMNHPPTPAARSGHARSKIYLISASNVWADQLSKGNLTAFAHKPTARVRGPRDFWLHKSALTCTRTMLRGAPNIDTRRNRTREGAIDIPVAQNPEVGSQAPHGVQARGWTRVVNLPAPLSLHL